MDWFDFSLKLPITDPTWIFLLVLLIILFAPILLNKLRIPHIIGMILAGLVIGEHGFNILVRDSSFELFGKVGTKITIYNSSDPGPLGKPALQKIPGSQTWDPTDPAI